MNDDLIDISGSMFIGTVYPTYASFKAVKTVDLDDDSQWLMYWITYAFFIFVESVTDKLIFWRVPIFFWLLPILLLFVVTGSCSVLT